MNVPASLTHNAASSVRSLSPLGERVGVRVVPVPREMALARIDLTEEQATQ
jgi:hypothetical protein